MTSIMTLFRCSANIDTTLLQRDCASSAADSYNNCAFLEKSMLFLETIVHNIRFILRCGENSDLTLDDRESCKI